MRYCILLKPAGPKSRMIDFLLARLWRNCVPCLTDQSMKDHLTRSTPPFHLRFRRAIPSLSLSPQLLWRSWAIRKHNYGALDMPFRDCVYKIVLGILYTPSPVDTPQQVACPRSIQHTSSSL